MASAMISDDPISVFSVCLPVRMSSGSLADSGFLEIRASV